MPILGIAKNNLVKLYFSRLFHVMSPRLLLKGSRTFYVEERSMLGGTRYLEARVDTLERQSQSFIAHISHCEKLGEENREINRENQEHLLRLVEMVNTNARECIKAAHDVQVEMQKTFLKYMGTAVIGLIGAVWGLLKFHV
jgi:hypothetical protein